MPENTLPYLSPSQGFQDPDRDGVDAPEAARAVVIPFGLEASVSYGGGTRRGPAAILAASQQLELFDEELWCEPYKAFGIATLAEPNIADSVDAALDQLEGLVEVGNREGVSAKRAVAEGTVDVCLGKAWGDADYLVVVGYRQFGIVQSEVRVPSIVIGRRQLPLRALAILDDRGASGNA